MASFLPLARSREVVLDRSRPGPRTHSASYERPALQHFSHRYAIYGRRKKRVCAVPWTFVVRPTPSVADIDQIQSGHDEGTVEEEEQAPTEVVGLQAPRWLSFPPSPARSRRHLLQALAFKREELDFDGENVIHAAAHLFF